jgi:isocitrate lyase
MLRNSITKSLRLSSSTRQQLPRLALSSRVVLPRASSMTVPRFNSTSSSSSPPLYRLDPPTEAEEAADFAAQIASIEEWFSSPRFAGLKRPYSAELVATKRGTQPISPLQPANVSAKKLHASLTRAQEAGRPLHTMGAIDPIQMTQMAPHLDVLYVSGWAASSVLTTGNNEVGPDLADYPYTTVPNQVQRLRKAQEMHDRKMWDERRNGKGPWVDYLRPIIADGDTGFVLPLRCLSLSDLAS